MNSKTFDVAVVGGGPGGYAAALYCARAGLSVCVLEKLSPGGQMATTSQIENYPGFADGIDGFELAERMQQGAERAGAVTVFAEVNAFDLTSQPKRLTTSDGVYEAGAVILATGANPRPLGVPGEDTFRGRGVAYCATCDGMMYRGKRVAVVGGGNSAVEDALFLSNICEHVTLIHRRDALRASKAEANRLARHQNLSYAWNSRVQSLLDDGQKITGLQLQDTKTGAVSTLDCNAVFVAVGRVPNSAPFASLAASDEQGYLIADESTRTSLPGVFAVGDLRTKPLRQVVTAVSDGAVASKFAEEYLASL